MQRDDSESQAAVAVVWRAIWTSRLVVLLSGMFAVLSFGRAARNPGVRPRQSDRAVRVLRQPAGGAVRALGLGLVSGDRAGRLRPRGHAHRVLSAVPTGAARTGPDHRIRSRRRRAGLAGRVRDRAAGAAPARHARARPAARERDRDAGRVLPDVVLLLGRLQRVAVPGAVGGMRAAGAPGPVGLGRRARRARRRLAQQRDRADGADRAAVPVRTTRRPGTDAPRGRHACRSYCRAIRSPRRSPGRGSFRSGSARTSAGWR